MVHEFLDVFIKDLSAVPPKRQVDLRIDLILGVIQIYNKQYQLAILEMRELSN